MKTDILCFGAHSDDVEIGMGGTIAKYTDRGHTVVICDLTEAELSSNGTPANRIKEANQAAAILGVKERLNLNMGDRQLYPTPENISKIVSVIRKYKPEVIFIPAVPDRHPDHGHCASLVEEAVFSAGIKNYVDEEKQEAHKPKYVFYYMINSFHQPDFFFFFTDYFQCKLSSLKSYSSQFVKSENGVTTPLTEGYLEAIEGRERAYGRETGVLFAEGFKTKRTLLLDQDLLGGTI